MSQEDPQDSHDSHMADRARRAAKIVAEPANYKVCEGCESVVAARVDICPNCYGYRFDAAAESVIRQAEILAKRQQTSVIADDLS